MKALIVELREGRAVALREDGVVVKIRKKCSVGDTIDLSPALRRFPGARGLVAAAAAFLLCFGTGGYGYMTALACSYVSVDVNPSVEFSLNRLDRVIGIEGINEEGIQLAAALKEQGVLGATLSEALEQTTELLPEEAAADEEERCLLLNVTSESDERADRLIAEARKDFPKKPRKNMKLVVNKASPETRERARKHGISAGRFEEIMEIEGGPEHAEKQIGHYQGMDVRGLLEKSGGIPSRKPSEKKDAAPEKRPGGLKEHSPGNAAGEKKSGGADRETQL